MFAGTLYPSDPLPHYSGHPDIPINAAGAIDNLIRRCFIKVSFFCTDPLDFLFSVLYVYACAWVLICDVPMYRSGLFHVVH